MWELPIVVLYSLSGFPLFILLRARLCTALFEWGACLLDGMDHAVVFSTLSGDLVEKIRGPKSRSHALGIMYFGVCIRKCCQTVRSFQHDN